MNKRFVSVPLKKIKQGHRLSREKAVITQKELTSSFVFLLAGAGYLSYNAGYSLDTWNNPGPGIFPLIVGVTFMILTVFQLGHALRRPKEGRDQERVGWNLGSAKASLREGVRAKPFLLVIVIILYLLMAKGAGFFISNFLFVTVSSKLLGARDWRGPIALAAGIDLFCYLLFEVWLKLSLPRGYLF